MFINYAILIMKPSAFVDSSDEEVCVCVCVCARAHARIPILATYHLCRDLMSPKQIILAMFRYVGICR